jgi:hypothetical protein
MDATMMVGVSRLPCFRLNGSLALGFLTLLILGEKVEERLMMLGFIV